MRTVTLFGGPLDGKTVDVPSGALNLVFPVLDPDSREIVASALHDEVLDAANLETALTVDPVFREVVYDHHGRFVTQA